MPRRRLFSRRDPRIAAPLVVALEELYASAMGSKPDDFERCCQSAELTQDGAFRLLPTIQAVVLGEAIRELHNRPSRPAERESVIAYAVNRATMGSLLNEPLARELCDFSQVRNSSHEDPLSYAHDYLPTMTLLTAAAYQKGKQGENWRRSFQKALALYERRADTIDREITKRKRAAPDG